MPSPQFAFSTFAWDLFHRPALVDYLNLGAGAIFLAALGLAGLWRMLRDRRRSVAAAVLLAVVVIPVAGIMSDAMLSQRTFFAPVAGRFIAPSVAALALLGSIVAGRAAAWMRTLAVLGGAWYSMPRAVSEVELMAMTRVAPYAIAGVTIGVITAGIGWKVRRTAAGLTAGCVAGALLFAVGLHSTREAFRYRIYRAIGESAPAPYDLVPLGSFLVAWQIWSDLDREEPLRIAFAAGWDNFNGHTSYRYPLLGSRLQNAVMYVPPTTDGEVIDYKQRDQLLAKLDLHAWVRRLIAQRIDIVVVSVPGVPELEWMRRHRGAFAPFSKSPDGTWTWAFRVNSNEAQALVDCASAQ